MNQADALSDLQLTGQRIMVGFEGEVLDHRLATMITDLCVGGLVLFKRNVSDPKQLSMLCRNVQALSKQVGNPPLLIAIDQEGGPVARLGPPFTTFPGQRAIGRSRSQTAAKEFGEVTARELRGVGINMNFSPVLDTVPSEDEAFVMNDRVFGDSPELVMDLGVTVIDSTQSNGVAATAKHFPGIGRTTVDSHAELPFLETSKNTLFSTDLVPFRGAIQHNVAAVMLAHVVYAGIDGEWPASLSKKVAKGLLRGSMGFSGVSITDDLDMGAIAGHFDLQTVADRICHAEVDVALVCRERSTIDQLHTRLTEAANASEESRAAHLESVNRVLAVKAAYIEGRENPSV